MEAILTLKSKNIPRYYSSMIYGLPVSLILLVSIIDDASFNKIFIFFLVLVGYLYYLSTFDKKVFNDVEMCETIKVFQDHILINSQYKLEIKDIQCKRKFGPSYPPSARLVYPFYDFIEIKDTNDRILYEIYFKVIWHDVFDYSSYKFVELINSLKFRVEAIDKGNEMVTKL
ncbi:MAG: hypothetical protein PHW18_11595, partial [Sulfuricurvum sp.]